MMMAKLLRIPSFQCCRSHDISVVPTDPPPPPPPPPSSKPHHSSLRRHVYSALRTASCACRRSSSTNSDDEGPPNLPRHVPPTPLPESHDDAVSVPSKLRNKKKKKKKKSKSTTTTTRTLTRLRISTSSADSTEIDELQETETLICSNSSTDGDDPVREKPYKSKKSKKKKNRRQKSPEVSSPARLSVFQRLIPCTVEGKIRESFAVVKRSEDPFEDFKRSMMEMIIEKEMFGHTDLEQLLHCLLSLNDREFHHIIVQAFSEIWHDLFSNSSTCRTSF